MAAKKKASKKKGTPARKAAAVKSPMTKTAMLEQIAGNTGITKKQASSVFDELTTLIESHVKKGSVGQFTFPGLLKIEVRHKPATKARKGINPATKQRIDLVAINVPRFKAGKNLREIVRSVKLG